jgi:hypothetical protein
MVYGFFLAGGGLEIGDLGFGGERKERRKTRWEGIGLGRVIRITCGAEIHSHDVLIVLHLVARYGLEILCNGNHCDRNILDTRRRQTDCKDTNDNSRIRHLTPHMTLHHFAGLAPNLRFGFCLVTPFSFFSSNKSILALSFVYAGGARADSDSDRRLAFTRVRAGEDGGVG